MSGFNNWVLKFLNIQESAPANYDRPAILHYWKQTPIVFKHVRSINQEMQYEPLLIITYSSSANSTESIFYFILFLFFNLVSFLLLFR